MMSNNSSFDMDIYIFGISLNVVEFLSQGNRQRQKSGVVL